MPPAGLGIMGCGDLVSDNKTGRIQGSGLRHPQTVNRIDALRKQAPATTSDNTAMMTPATRREGSCGGGWVAGVREG